MKKININVPEEFLAKIDDFADQKHMTRTAYILSAVADRISTDEFLKAQPDITRKMQELTEALNEVAKSNDKDFAGIFGQERIDL